jgi:hypothetical protein
VVIARTVMMVTFTFTRTGTRNGAWLIMPTWNSTNQRSDKPTPTPLNARFQQNRRPGASSPKVPLGFWPEWHVPKS